MQVSISAEREVIQVAASPARRGITLHAKFCVTLDADVSGGRNSETHHTVRPKQEPSSEFNQASGCILLVNEPLPSILSAGSVRGEKRYDEPICLCGDDLYFVNAFVSGSAHYRQTDIAVVRRLG